jgi:cytochrome c biogenesis protein CcdA
MLVLVGLVGGVITGLSPCVLPVLPVVLLGGGAGQDGEPAGRRPYLIVLGLTLSFAVFTLFGSLILASLQLPGDTIRWLGLALLVLVGLGLLAGKGAGITLAFHASDVYLDVGGTGTLTVSSGGTSKVIRVSGAPDIYTVAAQQPARDGSVTIDLSPGLQAYSFTFG